MAKFCAALTWAFLLALAGSAWAVDGVVDINQARALAGGVSPGDTAGFPVTISETGSYRLTGNLTVPDANTTAISIAADNVTVDLNGFSILGPCTGGPPCSPTGSGRGIDAPSLNTTVLNGTVQGMGAEGMRLCRGRVDGATAVSNGSHGIFRGGASSPCREVSVANSTATRNGGAGISGGTTVTNSTATNNSLSTGIDAETVTNSIADGNSTGITAVTVTGCTAIANTSDGIIAITVATSTANGNGGTGITATTVTGSTAAGNTASQVSATGIVGHNICNGSPCP